MVDTAAHQQRINEAQQAVAEWEAKLAAAREVAEQVERDAGPAALDGADLGVLGGQIAAARSAIEAAQQGLAQAIAVRERAQAEFELAQAADLHEQIKWRQAEAVRQQQEAKALQAKHRAEAGFCAWVYQPGGLDGEAMNMASRAGTLEQSARRRLAKVEKQPTPVAA